MPLSMDPPLRADAARLMKRLTQDAPPSPVALQHAERPRRERSKSGTGRRTPSVGHPAPPVDVQVPIPVRCVYCGDSIPGRWESLPLWTWCPDCRAWWHYLRQQRRRQKRAVPLATSTSPLRKMRWL
jgi:hypothetical protein